MTTIELLKQSIKGVNKFMTDEFVDSLSYVELLCNCPPIYREEFENKLKKEGLL